MKNLSHLESSCFQLLMISLNAQTNFILWQAFFKSILCSLQYKIQDYLIREEILAEFNLADRKKIKFWREFNLADHSKIKFWREFILADRKKIFSRSFLIKGKVQQKGKCIVEIDNFYLSVFVFSCFWDFVQKITRCSK